MDHNRLIECLRSQSGDIVVEQGGLSSLEGMLVARGLMYSAVYFHRVTRVTEVMLSRAVERAGEIISLTPWTSRGEWMPRYGQNWTRSGILERYGY